MISITIWKSSPVCVYLSRESCSEGSVVELIQILQSRGFRWTCTDNEPWVFLSVLFLVLWSHNIRPALLQMLAERWTSWSRFPEVTISYVSTGPWWCFSASRTPNRLPAKHVQAARCTEGASHWIASPTDYSTFIETLLSLCIMYTSQCIVLKLLTKC